MNHLALNKWSEHAKLLLLIILCFASFCITHDVKIAGTCYSKRGRTLVLVENLELPQGEENQFHGHEKAKQ